MTAFVYKAVFEPGDERGVVVTFPDVPEAITQGDDEQDALTMAEEALGLALLSYVAQSRALPKPATRGRNLVSVAVPPDIAAKLALIEAFQQSGMSKTELGRRLGKDEKEIRRILDPRHPTKLNTLSSALRILGRQLVMAVKKQTNPANQAAEHAAP
jgi:antitoxin HicB